MKNGITELVFILDRSGSMSGLEADTIGGFNSMLEKQKQEPGACWVNTVLFDHETQVLHDRVPLAQVHPSRTGSITSGAPPPCWTPWAAPSTTSLPSTGTPGRRTCRSTPFS